MAKIIKPINPLIFKTALEFAAVFYEAGRSSGLKSKHKDAKSYAKANLEKFIPRVIQTFIQMLKPTSNMTEHQRQEIYHALVDPINDPDLMSGGKKNGLPDINAQKLDEIIKQYDKNKIKFAIASSQNVGKPKLDLKGSTSLSQDLPKV